MEYVFKVYTDASKTNSYTRKVNKDNLKDAIEIVEGFIDLFRVKTALQDKLHIIPNFVGMPFKFVKQFPFVVEAFIDPSVPYPIKVVNVKKGDKMGLIDLPEGEYLYDVTCSKEVI